MADQEKNGQEKAPEGADTSHKGQSHEQVKEQDKKDPPGGFDQTSLPSAPPGYTIKITFHRATALPLADLSTLSSDPYVYAELRTALPTRHKEDPSLKFRTRTVWKNTEPVWDQEWILANIPSSGFRLKARLYDEDSSDKDDRLGNVHIDVDRIDEKWQGYKNEAFPIKKKTGSWRAYGVRAMAVCMRRKKHMHGSLFVSVEVLGKTAGDDGSRAYTCGLNYWCKNFSPLLGRLVGNRDDDAPEGQSSKATDAPGPSQTSQQGGQGHAKTGSRGSNSSKKARRYNFESNQFQLAGPVPKEMYHRYVEFKPFMKSMFTGSGIRGLILSKALHHQHRSVYNFNRDTQYGVFDEPSKDMTLKFLELCHWDQGGRIHTYVLTLDALMRFTETGKEFGIDLLSKHTMHSDVSVYIAFSGEFFIRRLKHPNRGAPDAQNSTQEASSSAQDNATHPPEPLPGGPPDDDPPRDPAYYELVIDNDSGTYRPNAKLLPELRHFLERSFPGLKIVTLDCSKDEELMNKLKQQQRDRKKAEGQKMVYTQKKRSDSLSSSDDERLEAIANRDQPSSSSEPKHKHQLGDAMGPFLGDHEHARAILGGEKV